MDRGILAAVSQALFAVGDDMQVIDNLLCLFLCLAADERAKAADDVRKVIAHLNQKEWQVQAQHSLGFLHLFICTCERTLTLGEKDFLAKYRDFVADIPWMLEDWALDLIEIGYFDYLDLKTLSAEPKTWSLLAAASTHAS